MAGAKISIGYDDQEAKAGLARLAKATEDLRPMFADIGEYLLRSHDDRWRKQEDPQGAPWAPLSRTTKKLKSKNTEKILVRDDYLRGTLRYQAVRRQLEFGSDRPYAAMHQFGGTTSPKSMIPNKHIPARPFLGVSDADRNEIEALVQEHLTKAIGRN